jgi:transcriptional regulator with XRE-family HTH domain
VTYTQVQRRLIGEALRRHRERLGYNLADAARVIDCDRSKVSRLERGLLGIGKLELQALLAEYGVGEQEHEALVAIVDRRLKHGWWWDYRDILSRAFQDYLALESAANEIRLYDSQRIPDLLQTADYARAITELGMWLPGPAARQRLVEVQLARQRAIMGHSRPQIRVIVGEAALRAVVGSAEVMRAQIRRLAEVGTTYDWVTLHVLPVSSAPHGLVTNGSMTVLQYAGPLELGVVHLPRMSDVVCTVDPAEVISYAAAFAQLEAAALDPLMSLKMLRVRAGGLTDLEYSGGRAGEDGDRPPSCGRPLSGGGWCRGG